MWSTLIRLIVIVGHQDSVPFFSITLLCYNFFLLKKTVEHQNKIGYFPLPQNYSRAHQTHIHTYTNIHFAKKTINSFQFIIHIQNSTTPSQVILLVSACRKSLPVPISPEPYRPVVPDINHPICEFVQLVEHLTRKITPSANTHTLPPTSEKLWFFVTSSRFINAVVSEESKAAPALRRSIKVLPAG